MPMASEKTANKARELFSDQLFGSGAHAVAVDKVSIEGEETFALIAMVPPSHKQKLPASVAVTVGDKLLSVPVVVRKTAPYEPE
jgi:hypothetical protein